ncbi:MAG TPA: diaminopimelate decarboxylase [Rhodospirillaceae bacterium]|nr:diaminopimelate decarboxylase [Rhodospirillaceae bacterium]MBL25331.1 diaminopimelate decarboxylase [Rhodospirillaceae bacterium]HAT34555.1 diaminopimelate decarboxylase [Rhodospirillaceae bacterium]
MNHFEYRDGALYAEDVALEKIADSVGTPFYCYSAATLTYQFRLFSEAFSGRDTLVCFAVKANPNLAVIRTLAALGAGADVVSEGELRRALAAGVPADRVVFSGVGKTKDEMRFALEQGILQINVESLPELEALSEVATAMGVEAEVAVRVNPDVDADTHDKIATGRQEDKFGIDIAAAGAVYDRAAQLPGIQPVAVAVHIGSQLTDLAPFRTAFTRLAQLVRQLRVAGHEIRRLDLGGGLGIPYNEDADIPPLPDVYAQMVEETVGDLGCTLMFEPGRIVAGNAGLLVTKVVYLKEGGERRFAIVDAAMNDLMRPALYDAHHGIQPVRQPPIDADIGLVDVVGPVCETGDTFARRRALPPVAEGDLLAIKSAGAYGASMASTYNSRPLVPEILVRGDEFAIVRERPSYEDMLAPERFADWQA